MVLELICVFAYTCMLKSDVMLTSGMAAFSITLESHVILMSDMTAVPLLWHSLQRCRHDLGGTLCFEGLFSLIGT